MRQSGFEPEAVLLHYLYPIRMSSVTTPEPPETAIDKIISFIVHSPLIFNHDKVKFIIEIKIEIDIENPKE